MPSGGGHIIRAVSIKERELQAMSLFVFLRDFFVEMRPDFKQVLAI